MRDPFRSQRIMREVRRVALEQGTIAVLDLGTRKFACLVLRVEDKTQSPEENIASLEGQEGVRVIGSAETRARGMFCGAIDTMPEAERAIRTVVQSAQRAAGVRVNHVVATCSGVAPNSFVTSGAYHLGGARVGEYEMESVLSACDLPDDMSDREILHALPVNFSLDQRQIIGDPRGQVGDKLLVDVHLVTCDSASLRNLAHCIARCDLELAGIAASSYAAAAAALVEDEQKLGAACIDIGDGTTDVAIFFRGNLIHLDCLRLGGGHVTSDISLGLQIPTSVAERIKTFYGGVSATGVQEREVVDLGPDADAQVLNRRSIAVAELIGIMRPRFEEILEAVRASLDNAGFEQLPSQQIVLTGGSSQALGLDGLAARVLGRQARLGRPIRLRGLPHTVAGPNFAAAVGLCLQAVSPREEWWDLATPLEEVAQQPWRRAVHWLRDNW